MTGYLEQTYSKFSLQLSNFASKIDIYATNFSFTPAELASV
jgi:hypothetical protein